MRVLLKSLCVLAVLSLPLPALAQSITGTVRDDSGAVLPGVTVEASSPALIEKTKSAVTDGTGQYRIVDLRPGTYSLTFTLPGFTSVKRDGIELTGSQTLTIAIQMKVGGLEETITVSGETPVVDVQNARREMVIQNETIQQLPITRAAGALLNVTPGVNVSDAGTALSPTMTSFNARSSTINAGSVAGEGRYMLNGFPLTAARSGGFTSFVYDTVNADEVTVTVGGGLGESDIGGPLMNIVLALGRQRVQRQRLPEHCRQVVERRQPERRHQGAQPEPAAGAGSHQRLRLQRIVRRADHEGPPLVLRQLSRPEHICRRWKAFRRTPMPATRVAGTGSANRPRHG